MSTGTALEHHALAAESEAAVAELRAGQPGPAVIGLIGRTIVAVARRYHHPHPDADVHWGDPDAAATAVSVFFTDGEAQRKLDTLALEATTDEQLRRLLQTTVYNWFVDLTRQTERGRLYRSTRRRLREEPDVFTEVVPKNFWTLVDDPHEAGIVDHATLDRALASVNITVIRARPDAEIARPWASRAHQIAALHAMLTAAARAVLLTDIVRAIAARIGLLAGPTTIPVEEAGETIDARSAVEATDGGADADRAAEVFEQLSDRERRVLIRHEQTTRQVEEETGIPRSSVSDVRARLREALDRTGLRHEPGVLAELIAACEEFDRARTTGGDSSSTPIEEEGRGEG